MNLYDWQLDDWQQISREFSSIPNAWLLTGDAGIGKVNFAKVLAKSLLCEQIQPDKLFCNICQSCRLFDSQQHPSFLYVTDITDAANQKTDVRKLPVINVDSVRDLVGFAKRDAHNSARKVIVIAPAEAMNIQASNALLKVLEEPRSNLVFILVSGKRDRLLPTIKSRCRQYRLKTPNEQQSLNWLNQQGIERAGFELALHGGRPLFEINQEVDLLHQKFIDMLKQPRLMLILQLTEQIEQTKLSLSLPLEWLSKWIIDMVTLSLSGIIRYHQEEQSALLLLMNRVKSKDMFAYYDKVNLFVPFATHTLNVRLQIEALLIEYLRLFSK